MGQHLPDRLFWAREDDDAAAEEAPAPPPRSSDVRSSH
jgi:hypothetical protein